MTCRIRSIAAVLAIWALAASRAAGQNVPVSPDAFRAGDAKTRTAILNQLCTHDVSLPVAELVSLLEAGLRDGDGDVRVTALNAVASQATSPLRWSGASPPRRDRAHAAWRNRSILIGNLRSLVVAALDDDDPRLRHTAIIALANMDLERADGQAKLSAQTAVDLAARHQREPDAGLRAEITGALAHDAADSPEVRQALTSALHDPDSRIREHALRGGQRFKLPEVVPAAVSALEDSNWELRLAAADALTSAGRESAPYQSVVERALAREQTAAVKLALERALMRGRRD